MKPKLQLITSEQQVSLNVGDDSQPQMDFVVDELRRHFLDIKVFNPYVYLSFARCYTVLKKFPVIHGQFQPSCVCNLSVKVGRRLPLTL